MLGTDGHDNYSDNGNNCTALHSAGELLTTNILQMVNVTYILYITYLI